MQCVFTGKNIRLVVWCLVLGGGYEGRFVPTANVNAIPCDYLVAQRKLFRQKLLVRRVYPATIGCRPDLTSPFVTPDIKCAVAKLLLSLCR